MRMLLAGLSLLGILACTGAALAAEPTLTLSFGGEERRHSASELLARPDTQTITIPDDVSYKQSMTYRAVPLLDLLRGMPMQGVGTIEARGTDGFASQIPLALVEKAATGGSSAWIAVEDAAAPWPPLPGKTVSAGPLYLVWEHPERSKVGPELWPYQLGALAGVEPPARRWPQMAVGASLPADAPVRRGQAVFTEQCMSCHRMKGAGTGDIGPDLGKPMGPTQYFQPEALRQLIRDPKSLRAADARVRSLGAARCGSRCTGRISRLHGPALARHAAAKKSGNPPTTDRHLPLALLHDRPLHPMSICQLPAKPFLAAITLARASTGGPSDAPVTLAREMSWR